MLGMRVVVEVLPGKGMLMGMFPFLRMAPVMEVGMIPVAQRLAVMEMLAVK